MSEVRAHHAAAEGALRFASTSWARSRHSAQLARGRCAHHLRDRRRAHPGPRRPRRLRDGHPHREARPLHRVRGRAPGAHAPGDARPRHQQRGVPRGPALPGPAHEAHRGRGVRRIPRRVRAGRAGGLPALLHPVRGLHQQDGHSAAAALPRSRVLLQRRHSGHRGGGRGGGD